MRPVPIPDARIWADDHGQPLPRQTFGAPRGYETQVQPIEVLADHDPALGSSMFHVLLALEDQDLERLVADPHIWLTLWGHIVPFALSVPGQLVADGPPLAYRVQVDGRTLDLPPEDVTLIYPGPSRPPTGPVG